MDRADNTYTVCEIKYQHRAPGVELIPDMERRITFLKAPTTKSIHKVLITMTPPTKELIKSGYFHKVILAEALVA